MNHKKGFNKLNRNASHRRALLRNMATVLFKHERIVTTKAKALELRRVAEKMITRAKEDSVHNRRVVGEKIKDQGILAKLFTDIGPRMKERNGGYTRILKIGFRAQDAANMVVIELVDHKPEDAKDSGKKKAEKAEKKAPKPEARKTASKIKEAAKPEAKKPAAKKAKAEAQAE
ncbi:MAG: 50S ribosomal protein L17 [Spirochaetes bacterium RIFOXYC1_FULL_54_7]|nr:MAG: 50S ribosomal protein L17 [Spirochaetes bacterium RIFOXYC1_FULL_54_7]